MDAEKLTRVERFFRLDSSFTDPDRHTMLERIFWALPPVLIGWMLAMLPILLVFGVLSGHLS
jgi:hypothetical protein